MINMFHFTVAAVNITTREEQFQSYKTENDSSSSTNYYTHSDMANIGQSPIIQYTTAKISNPIRTVACVTKSHSTSTESSSTSEFVDYSEVKLVRDKEDGKGVPTKRAKLRKKTTKKRDDECMPNIFYLLLNTFQILINLFFN